MGRSALHLAVDSESMETVELLLDRVNFECIEESLLHAISMGATKIVKVLTLHLRISALLSHDFVRDFFTLVVSIPVNVMHRIWCLSILLSPVCLPLPCSIYSKLLSRWQH